MLKIRPTEIATSPKTIQEHSDDTYCHRNKRNCVGRLRLWLKAGFIEKYPFWCFSTQKQPTQREKAEPKMFNASTSSRRS
jgi:hypothetical protein